MRTDPLTGEPVLIAPARAGRPHDVSRAHAPSGCPFCVGNEAATPPETQAERPGGGDADTPGWVGRAIPNKFPTIPADEGVHEVVINSPRHLSSLSQLAPDEATVAVRLWQARLGATSADPRGLTPFLFLNQGGRAGASLTHTHAQIVGLPLTPPRLRARSEAFAKGGASLLLGDVSPDRVVAEEFGLVAWCPEVPPLSGTIRVAPVEPRPDWRDDRLDVVGVGAMLVRLVSAVEGRLGAQDINLCLYERPPGGSNAYHWHLDVIPRLGTLAGLELGAGVIAAHRAPEDVARALRA